MLIFAGCAGTPRKYVYEYYDVFDTYTSLTVYAQSEKRADRFSETVHGEMLRLHRLFDIYNRYNGINNIKTINENAGISPVKTGPDVIDLLKRAVVAYEMTDGAVNAAMGPVLRIWHDYREKGSADEKNAMLPTMEELKKAAALCDIRDVDIDDENGTVFLKKKGMSLDVGAIAKGYAAEKAVRLAVMDGNFPALLNAGGNVIAVGKPPGRDYWSVGIESPDRDAAVRQTLAAMDASIVTSGDYQRFYTVDGVNYNHIIDPETLMPASRYRAVTVIHRDSATADILSTGAFILPVEKAKELVEGNGGEAVWTLQNGDIEETSGYGKIPKIKNGSAT